MVLKGVFRGKIKEKVKVPVSERGTKEALGCTVEILLGVCPVSLLFSMSTENTSHNLVIQLSLSCLLAGSLSAVSFPPSPWMHDKVRVRTETSNKFSCIHSAFSSVYNML